jgi:hypothetical protein
MVHDMIDMRSVVFYVARGGVREYSRGTTAIEMMQHRDRLAWVR